MPENERDKDNAEITDVPQGFKTWVANNQDRIARAEKQGTLPYFVRDNRDRVAHVGFASKKKGGSPKLGLKEEKIAIKAFEKENNSQTTLTKKQIVNRDELATLMGIDKKDVLPFMTHFDANELKPNIHYNEGIEYKENCQICVLAYEARRRGLNVTTKGYSEGGYPEYLAINTSRAWINPNVIKLSPKKGKVPMKDFLDNTKDIGRFHIGYDRTKNSGHIIVAERMRDGSLILYDPQSKTYPTIEAVISKIYQKSKLEILKVDDLDFDVNIVSNVLERL